MRPQSDLSLSKCARGARSVALGFALFLILALLPPLLLALESQVERNVEGADERATPQPLSPTPPSLEGSRSPGPSPEADPAITPISAVIPTPTPSATSTAPAPTAVPWAAGRATQPSPATASPTVTPAIPAEIPGPPSMADLPIARCWEPSELRYDPQLEALIEQALGPDAGRYGVVVRNLTSGTEAAVQPDKVFYAASLYKLAVLYEVYRQERQGRLAFSESLTITEEAAEQDLGTLALLGWSAGSVITVSQAVEAMITVSDNASAVLLADLVGWHNVDQGLRELGLRSMRVNDPALPVTAADLARLLERMACGRAVDEQASREMIGLLTRQRVRDRLPALLPESVIVANKTGNWENATHDAGIVYSPGATYVIVVLSETAWQSEPIARLSAAVYAYFNPSTESEGGLERGSEHEFTSSPEASTLARR